MTHGSVIFTYVHADEFCEQEEMKKTVTTLDEEVREGGGERDFYWSHLRKMLLKCRKGTG